METEHTRVGEERNLFNLDFNEFLSIGLSGDHVVEVRLGEEELLVGVKDEITHELLEVSVEDTSIVVVCDSATVHSFTDQVTESGPGELFFVSLDSLVQVKRNQVQ